MQRIHTTMPTIISHINPLPTKSTLYNHTLLHTMTVTLTEMTTIALFSETQATAQILMMQNTKIMMEGQSHRSTQTQVD